MQSCPVGQEVDDPHAQAPVGEHLSLLPGSHTLHAPPLAPQMGNAGAVHEIVEQQPAGQDVGLQTHEPPEHSWPEAHAGPVPHRHSPAAQVSP